MRLGYVPLSRLRTAADPQRDREYRQLAEGVYARLLQLLANLEDLLDQGYAVISSQPINLPFLPEMVVAIPLDPLGFDDLTLKIGPQHMGGRRGQLVTYRDLRRDLFLYAMEEEPRNNDDVLRAVKARKDTFIHEMIHYFDAKRYDPSYFAPEQIAKRKERTEQRSEQSTGPTEYLSTPQEFNAWYQDATARIEEMTERHLWSNVFVVLGRGGYLTSWENFRLALPVLLGEWRLDLLDDKYRRKALQRLYAFWQDYRDEVENQIYPVIRAEQERSNASL